MGHVQAARMDESNGSAEQGDIVLRDWTVSALSQQEGKLP
jgi:hypothetical protein